MTRSELRRNLEEHLTRDRLEELRAHELARLDPHRIDPGLHVAVARKLILFNEFQAVHRFFQTEGLASSLEDHLQSMRLYASIEQKMQERSSSSSKSLWTRCG